jgi:hypothetical protein
MTAILRFRVKFVSETIEEIFRLPLRVLSKVIGSARIFPEKPDVYTKSRSLGVMARENPTWHAMPIGARPGAFSPLSRPVSPEGIATPPHNFS